MRPSPPLNDFPSSPSSSWSSSIQDHLSPTTPESCFSPPPTIVSPDDFALQIDIQFDEAVGGPPRKSSITHLLPQPVVPSPKTDPCFPPEDDMNKLQVFMRNRDRWANMCDRLESSLPLRPHNAPRVPPVTQVAASDDFSWEAVHPSPMDPNELVDPSRYSLLIHEVSLLVGLAADDDLLPGDACPLVPDRSKQVPDILPLNLAPTKSLAFRKHKDAGLLHPVNANVQLHPSSVPIPASFSPHPNNANPSLHNEELPVVSSSNLVTPIARKKSADIVCTPPSPRRRQGQVFHFEPPLRNAVDLDETFFHPRKPPPKPIPNPLANRCSSLDRLECSLRKLEAHAPSNHRKSQSEGRSPDHVVQRKDKRPSLPPPRRLKKQQSTHETMLHNPSYLAHGCHFSGPPLPGPIPPHQYAVPQSCPAVPLDDEHLEEDLTPGSFMDMDIPLVEEASQKRQPQVMSKKKIKSLVSVAKRVSRGVIAWGKNLAVSTKPPATAQEMTTVQSAYLSL